MPTSSSFTQPSLLSKFFSLVKFSHTVFAMPFAMVGFFIAVQQEAFSLKWELLLAVVLCMITARNAAMAFNRYLDRNIDAKNPRTANREIPSGAIKASSALLFVVVNAVAFVITTYFINPLCFYLSPIALFVVLFYSYTKRFTALCHLVLGVGLGLAPIGAYIAVTGKFDSVPLFISFAVWFWTAGFDIIYALQDEGFDKSNKLHSIPSLLGARKALWVSKVFHIVTVLCLLVAGMLGGFNWLYYVGFSVFIGLLVYQHAIVSPTDLSRVNLSFGTTNGIASVLFAVLTIISLYI